jgi:hypothetical protein
MDSGKKYFTQALKQDPDNVLAQKMLKAVKKADTLK